jgi:hypothetical protein
MQLDASFPHPHPAPISVSKVWCSMNDSYNYTEAVPLVACSDILHPALCMRIATCSFCCPVLADDLFRCSGEYRLLRLPGDLWRIPRWSFRESCAILYLDIINISQWWRQFSDAPACSIFGFLLPLCRFLRAILIFCATGNIACYCVNVTLAVLYAAQRCVIFLCVYRDTYYTTLC